MLYWIDIIFEKCHKILKRNDIFIRIYFSENIKNKTTQSVNVLLKKDNKILFNLN
jgi:hypothetical protein